MQAPPATSEGGGAPMTNGASTNFHMIVEESFWPLRSNPTALRRLPMPSGVGSFLRQQALVRSVEHALQVHEEVSGRNLFGSGRAPASCYQRQRDLGDFPDSAGHRRIRFRPAHVNGPPFWPQDPRTPQSASAKHPRQAGISTVFARTADGERLGGGRRWIRSLGSLGCRPGPTRRKGRPPRPSC